MGDIKALADSGALKSAICYSLVRDSGLTIRPARRQWEMANSSGSGVVGEVDLIVTYLHTVIELKEVVVIRNPPVPLFLGIEWLDASQAWVGAVEHVGTVMFRDLFNLPVPSFPPVELIPERATYESEPRVVCSPLELIPERATYESEPRAVCSPLELIPERSAYEPEPRVVCSPLELIPERAAFEPEPRVVCSPLELIPEL